MSEFKFPKTLENPEGNDNKGISSKEDPKKIKIFNNRKTKEEYYKGLKKNRDEDEARKQKILNNTIYKGRDVEKYEKQKRKTDKNIENYWEIKLKNL